MARIGSALLLLFLFSFAFAEGPVVTATVDRNSMSVGDTFTYSVSVESSSSQDIRTPEWPNLNGFTMVNNWSGSEIQSVFANGKFETKRKQSFNIQLQARQEGVFELGASRVRVGDQMYQTQPITLRVSAGRAPSQPRAQQRQRQRQAPPSSGMSDVDDMFNQMLQNRLKRYGGVPDTGGQQLPEVSGSELFFIDAQVDKKRVYEGEQVTATYYLYSQGRVSEIDTLKYPTLAGFWKEDIELATRLNFKPAIINGIRYNRALLASYALFPIKAGKGVIDPYRAKCKVINAPAFGIPRTAQDTRENKPINIEVMPVPEEGKPANFAGAVGTFVVNTQADNRSPKTGQPVTIKYRFEGRGNAKLIELPKLQVPVGMDIYDTSNKSKFFKNGKSYKEFEILLIPRQVGAVEVPSLKLSLFDAVKKSYYELATDPITLNVQKGEDVDQLPSSVLAKGGLGGDSQRERVLPPISLEYESSFALNPFYIWGPTYLGIIGFLIWFSRIELGWGKKRDSLVRLIHRRMKRINDSLGDKNWRQAASDSTNLVYFVLGELSGLGGGSQELKKMILKAPPSFRRDYQEPLEKLMKELEVIAFAPEEVIGRLKDISEVSQRIKAVENLLLKATEQDFNENAEELI